MTKTTRATLEDLARTIKWAQKHDDDPAEVLEALGGIVRAADAAQRAQVAQMLDSGATWTDVGRRLGISRQAAAQRFGGRD